MNRYDKKDKPYFIAYNAKFDSDFIREMFVQRFNKFYGSYFHNPCIDVMQIAAFKFMCKGVKPENFKLGTVCKFMGIKINEDELHDAAYDILKTKELYNKLLKY